MDAITNLKLFNTSVETPLLQASTAYYDQLKSGSVETFQETLEKSIGALKDLSTKSGKAMEDYISGKNVDASSVMLTMEKSGMATNLAIQVRNRLLEGYRELNSIQV
jgi:flagellar hook-basal body complex protein FliE